MITTNPGRPRETQWHRRDERIAQLGVQGLVKCLRAMPGLNADSAILDFGCGYFDAGLAMIDRVDRIDGFDVEPVSVAAARARVTSWPNCSIYDSIGDIPRESYDLIVAHSVFQYLGDDEEVLRTLFLFRAALRPEGLGQVLIGDLIPPTYSSAKDALRDLWVAGKNGLLLPMFTHLYNSAFHGKGGRRHQIAAEKMVELAAQAGFRYEPLPVNLTASRQRYSCWLKTK